MRKKRCDEKSVRFLPSIILLAGLLILSIILFGCAEKRWVCYVDKNADSNCIKGDCVEMAEKGQLNCRKGNRIMKIYPLKEAFIYSVNPPTDIQKCRESGDKGEIK